MSVLAEICAVKKEHVAAQKAKVPLLNMRNAAERATRARGFVEALSVQEGPAFITEIKRKSPSKGFLFPDADAGAVAKIYADAGAACLSVLTDTPYFGGRDEDLITARTATSLPALRKDFMVDLYQIYESRALGADAILLILSALEDAQAQDMAALAQDLGMAALFETHDAGEVARAHDLGAHLIGVNARNLKTLAVDLATSRSLITCMPQGSLVVAESGISNPAVVAEFYALGYKAFLVGEALMRSTNIDAALKNLMGKN